MRRPQEMAVGGSEGVASPKMRRPGAQTSTPANSLRRIPLLMNSATNC